MQFIYEVIKELARPLELKLEIFSIAVLKFINTRAMNSVMMIMIIFY